MEYRRVGTSGLKISEISLGAWLTYGGSVDEERASKIIRAAIDREVNFLDIADIYSKGQAELIVGKVIKDYTRSDLVLSSKVYWPMSDNINDRGLSRKHIMEGVEKSLKRLGTDYLDMYFCHRFDKETPVDETVRAMSDLVQQGKVLYWGTSVWEAEEIERAAGSAERHRGYLPSVEQPRYNMMDRHIEERIMPTCARRGMGIVVWSPLAQGLLTGKYNENVPKGTRGGDTMWLAGHITPENIERVRKLTKIAVELDLSVGQLALAWILRRPEISSAIVGATNVAQLEENLVAAGVKLSDDVQLAIEEILGETPTTRFKF
ncbi:MAG: aldo/keto reductase family protein [candidate division Zixibacteria bacterium]|nr:aldo/keto reductase family protein [candidate division Zixibacteria bacterium]